MEQTYFTKNKIIVNIVFSILQVIITGITVFFLYRYLLKFIGLEQFGIWSIVMASTSSLGLLNSGFSASLVRYVAKYTSLKDNLTTELLIETTFISLSISFGFLLCISYPLFKELFKVLISSSSNLKEAYQILPYCLISFWLLIVSGVFQSALDGFNQIYLKNIITVCSSTFNFILSILLVPKYGIIGLSFSYLINNVFILILSWFLLKKILPSLPIITFRWNKTIFKETLSYSYNFQIITIASMLNDPVTKAILTKFGGLEMTGLYEMASKLVIQARALIASANQALIPVFANLQEQEPDKISVYYRHSYKYIFFLSILTFFSIVACAPIISLLWLGLLNETFIFFTIILSLGWLINTLSVPAYFVNIGIGTMKWNTISHVSMGILNLILCLCIALLGGESVIIWGWIIALSVCSLIIIIGYHLENKIPFKEIIPEQNNYFFFFTVLNTGMVYIFNFVLFTQQSLTNLFYSILLFALVEAIIIWNHPLKNEIMSYLYKYKSKIKL